jgi:hypothetical protein
MSLEMPELEDQLSQIDRRLREIQDDLAPNGNAPEAKPAERAPARPEMPPAVERLTVLQANLLSSMTEVLAQFQHTLAQMQQPASTNLTVCAGPFTTIAAVHAFERDLARLPGVREVSLRGYEGDDRVVIDVKLAT